MYRIKENTGDYMEGKYYLQKKFFWWWFDVTQEYVCIDGLAWHERIWFDTVEEAEEWINPKNNDRVIKYVQG